MLNKLSTFLGLSAKSKTYTKDYRVSDIMMYDRKGSLQGSVRLSVRSAKETYSKHENRPNLPYTHKL